MIVGNSRSIDDAKAHKIDWRLPCEWRPGRKGALPGNGTFNLIGGNYVCNYLVSRLCQKRGVAHNKVLHQRLLLE